MNSLAPYINEYWLLTPKEKAYVANGCGPKFGALHIMIPDFNGLYTPACNLHDWIYWCGGPLAMRDIADLKMKEDMEITNNQFSWWKKWSLSWAPPTYYRLIRWFGKHVWYRAMYRRTIVDLRKEIRNASL